MKKIILVFGILFLISFVSASLCKGSDEYYSDCGSSTSGYYGYSPYSDYNQNVILLNSESNWEDESDRYRLCLNDCDYKYRKECRSYSRYEKCSLKKNCYDSCTQRSNYFERVEYNENIQDLRNVYKESFENKYILKDERTGLYNEDRNEVIYLDKREYEYEKPYFSRDSAVIYINPYKNEKKGYSNQYNVQSNYDKSNSLYSDVFYLGRKPDYYDPNRAGYGYKYSSSDKSYWRYKKPYAWEDYQYCECDKWRGDECREWKCYNYNYDNYYYKPRMSFSGGYNWEW